MLVASIVVLLLGDAVALATIGADEGSTPAASETSVPSDGGNPTISAPVGSTPPPPPAPKQTSKSTTTTAALSPPPATASEGYRFEVTVTPTCVPVGGDITATLRLVPDAGFALMVLYSDGQSHEHWKAGKATGDGTVNYTWKAAAMAGDGSVTVQAQNPQSEQKGTTAAFFRVVKAGSKC